MSYCGTVSNVPYDVGSYYGGVVPTGGMLSVYGPGSLSGTGAWSGLGTLSGANIACTDQLPGSEVVIQPAPSVVTIPGPILSTTSEPATVAQTTPFASGYSGLGYQGLSPLYSGGALGGYGRLGYGGWRRYGRRVLPFNSWGYGACAPCAPYRPS